MFELIALLFPNIIGTSIVDCKNKLNIRNYLLCYVLITIIVNSIICLTFYFVKKELFVSFTCLFFVKYNMLSISLNIIIGLLIRWIINNFTFIFRRKK